MSEAASSRLRTALAASLVLLSLSVYGAVGGLGFLGYDDDVFVTANPWVRQGLNVRSVRWAFAADLLFETPYADYWAPLTVLSRMVDVELFGLRPAGHHLVNLLLHVATVVLAFLVLERLTGNPWRSAFAAAVMAVHPLHVESVAWVTERKDVLSGLLWWAAIGAYAGHVRAPAPWRRVAVALLFVLGLMTKPMLVTLPFVLLLLDRWPLRRRETVWELLREKWPLFLLSLASLAVTVGANLHTSLVTREAMPLRARLANAAAAYVAYLMQAVWPTGLAVGYPHEGATLGALRLVSSGLVLAWLTAMALRWRSSRPYLLVGWLWFLGTLVPTIGIVQTGVQGRADRFVYVPLFGLSLATVWWIADWAAAGGLPRRRASVAIGATVVLALAATARHQVGYWKNDLTLFTHAASVHGSAIAHNGLGGVFVRRGELPRAEAEFRAALRRQPRFLGALHNLANLLASLGRGEEAAGLLRDALDAWGPPGSAARAELLFELALVRVRQNRSAEAQSLYGQVIALDPQHWAALYNSGNLLVKEGRLPEAEARYAAARARNPDGIEIARNLALVKLLQGRAAESLVLVREGLQVDPGDPALHSTRGRALLALGRREEGLASLREAVRLAPGSGEAHFQLAAALEASGFRQEARRHYGEALRLNPADEDARAALAAR